ncbi:hypothetical protein F8280_04245 [Micromonospora noduli]|uniref:hypothetical protein n=1 Tax=Micromonospora noduli TaxID=709876 RepID=UPI00124BA4DE|nr:hypothetical protein [Micromonospora noduli]KAB1928250.1 hypothetical protein F8280_04245 [Micromonospora noduli]
MGDVVEVRSPVDVAQLRPRLGNADVVQFSEPLTEAEYRSVAMLLGDHPMVPLRVYGFDDDLATLRFLRWFPHVRRFSVAGLWHLTDLAPLDQLSADVEFLDIGETRKPLDLAPVAQFRRLRRLRVVAAVICPLVWRRNSCSDQQSPDWWRRSESFRRHRIGNWCGQLRHQLHQMVF